MDKKLIWWIFGVSSGGAVRARIVKKLHERPANANQLAKELGLEYNHVRYHLDILLKNALKFFVLLLCFFQEFFILFNNFCRQIFVLQFYKLI
jgi:hypothetical protein